MDTQSVDNTNALDRPRIYGLAIVSLVLSLLGMIPFPFILFPVLPLIGPIAGIITGKIARREIRANPSRYTGEGYAKAGVILGWIGIAFFLIIVVGGVLFFLLQITVQP
jgi:hypothetical protein